jgi:hypothetical protein
MDGEAGGRRRWREWWDGDGGFWLASWGWGLGFGLSKCRGLRIYLGTFHFSSGENGDLMRKSVSATRFSPFF